MGIFVNFINVKKKVVIYYYVLIVMYLELPINQKKNLIENYYLI